MNPRGVRTSEFWLVILAQVLAVVMAILTPEIENVAQDVTERGVAAVPAQIWVAIGGQISAALYAIGRGISKGLGGGPS